MKRILFWASGMFALGEVLYLYTDRKTSCSIAFAMLICLGIFFSKNKKIFKTAFFMSCFLIFGFSYIMLFDNVRPISMKMNDSNIQIEGREKNYTVYSYGRNREKVYYIKDSGIVVDTVADNRYVIVEVGSGMGKYRIIIYNTDKTYGEGELLLLEGKINPISGPVNPGVMDMRKYYGGRGILFSTTDDDMQITADDISEKYPVRCRWYGFKKILSDIREKLAQKIYSITDEKTAGFLISLLLGDKEYLEEDLNSLFQINGISHIMVISGLHISFIGSIIYKLLNGMGINRNISAGITITVVILYGNMTGAGYATMRVVIMLITSIFGERLSRDYDMLTAMSLALLILLLKNPFSILDGGMILSFFAIGGVCMGDYVKKVIWGTVKLKKMKRKPPVKYFFATTLVTSLSVNIMLVPVLCNLYYGIPVYSVLLNICIIPVMGIIIELGFAGLILSYINVVWGRLTYLPLKYILKIMESLCGITMKIPFHYINTGKESTVWMIVYYFGLFVTLIIISPAFGKYIRGILYKKKHIHPDRKRWRKIAGVMVMITVMTTAFLLRISHNSNQNSSAVFLDVGQGDGTLIKTGNGLNLVIDGGSMDNDKVGKYVICPALKYMNMGEVDYWFISHSDTDHVSGLEYIMEKGALSGINVKNIVIGNEFTDEEKMKKITDTAKQKGINVIVFNQGDCIIKDDMKISCLAPVESFSYEDGNQASMALSYETADISLLFTGDMDAEAVECMLNKSKGLMIEKYDILKLPHHGSRYSVSPELYRLFEGGYGVISAGKNNMYGHPHEEVTEELKKAGVRTLVTKDIGAVVVNIE